MSGGIGQDLMTGTNRARHVAMSSLLLGMVVAIALIAGTAGIVVALTRSPTPGHSSSASRVLGQDREASSEVNQISMTDLPPAGGKGGDPGDDYPWKGVAMDSELDPWREYVRECTSFVAWALHSRNGFEMPFYGDASTWGSQASRRGFTVNHTPAAGAVAWENPGDHVAWVSLVSGSSITIEEYNEHYNGTYDTRTLSSYEHFEFIHFKDLPTISSASPAPASTPPAAAAPPAPSAQGSASTPSGPTAPTQSNQPTMPPNGTSAAPSHPSSPSTSVPNSSGASSPSTQNPTQSPTPTATTPSTTAETVGGVSHTWSDYSDAGGTQGLSIPAYETVQIACKVSGFAVADGNKWWYRIASDPWNDAFYVSADAFYNNGATSGSLIGTPFVDPSVPTC